MRTITNSREITMNETCGFGGTEIILDKARILKALDCDPSRPIYQEMSELFEGFKEEVIGAIKPKVVFKISDVTPVSRQREEFTDAQIVIHSTATLGEGISKLIASRYAEDEYLEAMLIDAMGTNILFNINDAFYGFIYEYAEEKALGVKIFSPGERHFPMSYQKDVEEILGEANEVRVTEGYLLEPIKSGSVIYALKEGITRPRRAHDCKVCGDVTCKWRRCDES